MKKIISWFVCILILTGGLISCEYELEDEIIDPCVEKPTCIPDPSDWKLAYKPHNSDCTKCHTTCMPNPAHDFCDVGESWNKSAEDCLECHATQHQ